MMLQLKDRTALRNLYPKEWKRARDSALAGAASHMVKWKEDRQSHDKTPPVNAGLAEERHEEETLLVIAACRMADVTLYVGLIDDKANKLEKVEEKQHE